MKTPEKPKLSPVRVPWMISPSTPFLKLEEPRVGDLVRVTFAGYFRPDDRKKRENMSSLPEIVESVPAFVPRPFSDKSAYRMVRVSFEDGLRYRVCHAVSDIEVIRESDFDWSLVPIRRPGEKILEAQRRKAELWIQTGICPDPRMYEILGSPWIAELKLTDPLPWHHYTLLGHDEFIEVIGRSWTWEPGQPVWE
jgi:hypothetical protein